jgi:centromere/kinetochore protein ZW10
MRREPLQTTLTIIVGLNRYNLSKLVNSLLHTDSHPIPFEFLVNGQFLRSSIDDFLTKHGISAETTLNVEYTRALIPPIHVSSFEHDDWVSAVDLLSQTSSAGIWAKGVQSGQERILSASYDGLLRVWNMSGDAIATSAAPNNGGRITSLKVAKWVSDKKIVAAGLDNVVRVYKYDEDERTITPSLELYSHRWGVNDIAVHSPSNRILSASSDNTISVFSATAKDNPAAPSNLLPTSTVASNKRQKLSKPEKTIQSRGALSTFTGHASPVSSILFKPEDPTVAYSASHDHTLKTWDLPTSTCVDTRTTGHSLLSLAALPKLNLLATGTSARHITLIDPTNAVVSLDTHPGSEYGLVSGSHDGTARIWDVRSVKATSGLGEGQVGEDVYTIQRDSGPGRSSGEGVKVFGVRWESEVGIVSVGEDKRVQINRQIGS